ncbi:MAG: prepilin peptidase [Pirellulales bacterium]|nr:prepilin peptidase [Pirellulales bacterium]
MNKLPTLLWALWLFALGAAIGSFLNVVVYRLPRGLSLIRPGSHCPACGHPIRWYDNVPVASWFLLRGRCRDCRGPISARYPLVEAVSGGMFLALGWVELLSGGANLPARAVAVPGGLVYPPVSSGELIGVFAYHLLFLSWLLAAALVEWDGHPVSMRLVGLVGLFAPALWPALHPAALWPGWDVPLVGLLEGGAGLVVGMAIGWLVGRLAAPAHRQNLGWTVGSVGLFLGVQPVALVAVPLVAVLAVDAVLRRSGVVRRGVPPGFAVLILSFAWLLAWNHLERLWPF